LITLLTIFTILILSGICSCSETALYSISLAKVQKKAESGSRSAKALLKIKNKMDKYIGTIVFANNAINIFGASLLTGIVIHEFGQNWVNFFTAILTFLIIIFSEIIPKNFGEKKSSTIAPIVAYPVIVLTLILTPVLYLVDKIVKYFMSIIERKFFNNEEEDIVDEAEILATVDISLQDGAVDQTDRNQIKGILHLDDIIVNQIMTPASQFSSINENKSIAEIIDFLCDSQHSRILVTNDQNEYVGYIHNKSTIVLHIKGNNLKVKDILLPIISVQKTEIVDDVLEKLQVINTVHGNSFQQYISVVHDDLNSVVGVITLEDIHEEVFGQILDETDKHIDLRMLAKETLKKETSEKEIKENEIIDDQISTTNQEIINNNIIIEDNENTIDDPQIK
jgi:CBS domain containing-hemolysin-like protein